MSLRTTTSTWVRWSSNGRECGADENEVVIVSAVRTAGCRLGGSLKDVQPEDLAKVVILAAIERAGVEPEAVDETELRGWRAGSEHASQRLEVRLVQPAPVDLAGGYNLYNGQLSGRDDSAEELFPFACSAALRIVQRGKRSRARTSEALVVEDDASRDKRPGERSASNLVGPCDETHPKPTVELDQPPSAPAHRHEDNAACRWHRPG